MALFCILRAYASLLPTQKIQYPSDVSFGQAHDFVLHNICLSSHFTRYPPSARYQLSFWKWIISQFEAAIGEEDTSIDDRLYDRLFDAMSATRNEAAIENSVSPPPPTYVTHFWEPGSKARPLPVDKEILGKSTITLFESRTTIEAGTTGLRTWRASFVLAKFLISNPDVVRNSKVLELGSGTGFVGIVTASIQMLYRDESAPSSVTLTDVNEKVIQRCSDNLRLPCNVCSSHPNASVCPLDWTDALDSSKIVQLRQFVSALDPNVVLGADLIYHPDIIPALLATLVLTLKARSESATAYLALTVRNPHLFVSFLSTTAMYNLDVEELAEDVYAQSSTEFIEQSEGIDQDVKLLRIRTIAGP